MGTLNNRCRKGTLILTTTHMLNIPNITTVIKITRLIDESPKKIPSEGAPDGTLSERCNAWSSANLGRKTIPSVWTKLRVEAFRA